MSNFSEQDSKMAVDFVNFITKHAKFKLTVTENIELFKMLNWAQTSLLPKINANILEVKAVHEAPKPKPKARARKAK